MASDSRYGIEGLVDNKHKTFSQPRNEVWNVSKTLSVVVNGSSKRNVPNFEKKSEGQKQSGMLRQAKCT